MAIMFLRVSPVARSHGSNAVARAAYIARDRVRSEQLHRSFDYRSRGGLEHSEILVPQAVAGRAGWAQERAQLWNTAEDAERRQNARVAREYLVALPHELSGKARLELARGFAQTIADRYGAAIDLALHAPTAEGDSRNFHAHLLSTTREIGEHGLGRKTLIELNDARRFELGLGSQWNDIRLLRHAWAERANEYLHEAGLQQRLDARSHWERGDATVPQPRLTRAMIHVERSGERCEAAERFREQHAATQRLYHELRIEHESELRRQQQHAVDRLPEAGPAPSPAPDRAAGAEREQLTPADRDRLAVERWLAYRREHAHSPSVGAENTKELGRDHGAGLEF